MRKISVFGYSGSGKTRFIMSAIKQLKERLNYETAVIKYIHEHEIDEKGKDSYNFLNTGANYSILKNKFDENAIIFKSAVDTGVIIDWLNQGPLNVDIVFTESFRSLEYPAVLCVNDINEIEGQLTDKVKIISGLISMIKPMTDKYGDIPIINIKEDFDKFIAIFSIK